MSRLTVAAIVGFVGLISTAAAAQTQWKVSSKPYLEARSSEPETDAALRVLCRRADNVELRVGADVGLGEGKNEAVSLKLESNGKIIDLKGVSKRSEDFEMTGGAELVATVPLDHPLFSFLTTGKPVTLIGPSGKKVSPWITNSKEPVEKFVKASRAT